jgi:hypothetical protein
MSMDCDALRETLVFGRPLDEVGRAHLAGCPRCREDEASLIAVARALAADPVPEPAPALAAHVLAAAEPVLARHTRRVAWTSVLRAVGLAIVPLPLILLLDVYLVGALHSLLSALLPPTLSLYLVVNYAALLAFLLALTYGAIPLIAARQVGLGPKEHHV